MKIQEGALGHSCSIGGGFPSEASSADEQQRRRRRCAASRPPVLYISSRWGEFRNDSASFLPSENETLRNYAMTKNIFFLLDSFAIHYYDVA